jgi:hypothetical protein
MKFRIAKKLNLLRGLFKIGCGSFAGLPLPMKNSIGYNKPCRRSSSFRWNDNNFGD